MKLRADVEICEGADAATVVDAKTGLTLVVSHDIAHYLTRLRDEVFAQSSEAESESLLGFFREIGLLGELSEPELRARQARYILTDAEFAELPRVRDTVRRAHAHTALHREQLAHALRPGAEWDLETLPILHKSALRRHFPRGLTLDGVVLPEAIRRGDLMVTSTSGTTGERLQVYSDTRVPRLPENFAALWGLELQLERPLRTAVLTSPGCSGGVCTRRNATMEERTSFEHTLFLEVARDPFELSEAQLTTMAHELALFTPELWIVNPVYLLLVAERARRWNIALTPPRAIVTTYQGCSAALRARFTEQFGVPVFEQYSATELAGSQIGVSCRHGALHVRLDQAFVEICKDGARVEPGQLGHPVVTTHHPSMPLVRYQLTDLARFALTPCACEVGSAWPTLQVEGRTRDAFQRDGELVTTAMVDRALSPLAIALYQLHETQPGRFSLAVLAEDGHAPALEDARTRLRALLRSDAVEVCTATRLPFEESGKFRFTFPHVEVSRG